MVGLGGPAKVPRPQFPGRQFGADITGVVRIDPVVIFTAAFVVGKGGTHTLVEPFEQRLLRRRVSGPQMIEGEFGAQLKAGGAVVADTFVVQQRRRHVAAVQGESAGERGGVLEGLRRTLTKSGKHRMRRVAQQTDTALHPGIQRVPVIEAPLGWANDRPGQRDEVVPVWGLSERLADLTNDLLVSDRKPVAFLLLKLR